MKVKIEDGCIACGACESICEAVFTVEDVAIVNEANIAGNEECVKEAAEACPVSVIIIEQQIKIKLKQKTPLLISKGVF